MQPQSPIFFSSVIENISFTKRSFGKNQLLHYRLGNCLIVAPIGSSKGKLNLSVFSSNDLMVIEIGALVMHPFLFYLFLWPLGGI
jgi:hypothetical protein